MQKVIRLGSDRFETRHRRKDGTLFDVEISLQFNSETGGLCTCFLRDITKQKQIFKELKTTNEKMKLASDSARFGIWDFDVQKNRLSWDDWMFQIYGVNREDFLGAYEAWQAGVHPDDLERSNQEVADALRGDKDFDTEFRIVRPDGTVRHIRAYARVSWNDTGDPLHMTGINYDITEQKKAESALKESENRFRLAFMTSPDSININRLKDGVYIDINEGFTQIMGYTRDEVIGKSSVALDIWKNPEDRKRLVKELDEKGFVENLEAEFTGKDGRIRFGLMSARKITLNDEETILSITRDITERKKVEQALKSSEKKWRNILKNTPQIGISLNTKAEITFANEHFLALTGWKEHEVIGQNWFDLFIPENVRDDVRTVFHTVMGQKDTVGLSNYENEIVGKSGDVFNIAWSNVLTKDAEDNVIDVTCLGVDLTERRRSEDRLRKSETKYRTMMEAIKDPLYIGSQDYKIQYMNQAMSDRIGYDATGKFCYEALHGLDNRCPWCEYDETIVGDHSEKNIYSPLDNRSFNVSSTVFVNESGALSKLSVFRDTTEFLELQKRLQQSQKMESIGSLAGGIAHDFNNILFPIVGLSEMMVDDFPPGSLEQQNLNEILQAGKRGRDLVQQILSFSRQSEHQPIPVHIQRVLKEALKLCRATIPADIPITQNIMTGCGPVMADPTQIHQIAMNLITNAYHAVEPAGGTISVQLTETEVTPTDDPAEDLTPGRYAVLSVSDTGTGIDGAVIDKIFDPYFTTKEKGRGTGLGLATVYGIVKAHGGDIRVKSDLGKGTLFHVFLPLMEKRPDSEPEKEMTPLPSGTEHILLVDDEKAIVHLEKQMLKRLGYQTTGFTGSREALAAFKTAPSRFDVVITDMNMPDMNGMQLAAELIAVRPDIPIILCTGFSERIDRKKAEDQGIRGWLMKPVGMKDLAQTIQEVLAVTE